METTLDTMREEVMNRILIRLDDIGKLKTGNVIQIIETIAKLCFPVKDTWKMAFEFLVGAKEGIDIHQARYLIKKYKVSLGTFYYIRAKLMNMGLIDKTRGKYYLSDKFSNYMMALADAWDLVRRS